MILRDTVVDDIGDHKADLQVLWRHESRDQFHVAASYSDFKQGTVSLRTWTFSDDLTSFGYATVELPDSTVQRLYGGGWLVTGKYALCGSLRNIDLATGQVDEQTSRGVLLTFNVEGELESYESMGEHRPTKLFDVVPNHSKLLVVGADMSSSHFLAEIDRPSSVSSWTHAEHSCSEQQIPSWFDLQGSKVVEPGNGSYIMTWLCESGYMHTGLALYQAGTIIGVKSE
jgi:hypothetical protein